MIHNKGDKSTKFELELPKNFSVNIKEGVLDEKGTQQLVMCFYPKQRKYYEERGKLIYDGEEAEFILKGNAINGNVFLSQNHIKMEETYITLENR